MAQKCATQRKSIKKVSTNRASKERNAGDERPVQSLVTALPLELQIEIMCLLDYKSLMQMSSTCRHFHAVPTQSSQCLVKRALLKYEYDFPAWQVNVGGEMQYAPCYSCKRLLPPCNFRSKDWVSSESPFATEVEGAASPRFKRRCHNCRYGWDLQRLIGGPSQLVRRGNGYLLYCEGCCTLTHMASKRECSVCDHTRGGRIDLASSGPLDRGIELCKGCRPGHWGGKEAKPGLPSVPLP